MVVVAADVGAVNVVDVVASLFFLLRFGLNFRAFMFEQVAKNFLFLIRIK
jgi:hypothetical protein